MTNGGNWRFTQATAIGTAHLNQNTECQDRAVCALIEAGAGDILIAAVADGAGSTTDGQTGAEAACKTFVREITSVFETCAEATIKSINKDFGARWLLYFQKIISDMAQANDKTVRDYASTFIGAVIGADAASFFQIGDGALVYSVSGQPNSYRFGIEMPEAEYVNTTDFLTDETAVERLHYVWLEERIEDLILFSDGVSHVAVSQPNNQPHEPFLMPMIAPLRMGNAVSGLNEKLEKFLSSPKINEKTDDDKTIILASRH